MKKDLFQQFINNSRINFTSLFFWVFLVLFFTDRVVNFFFHFPLFVSGSIVLLPVLIIAPRYKNREKKQLCILIISFSGITIINSFVSVYDVKNISDALFIMLFFAVYYFYKHNIGHFKLSNVYLMLAISLVLFSFTFIGLDSNSIFSNLDNKSKEQVEIVLKTKAEVQAGNFTGNIKSLREYHNGLFRVTHVASYFFGFLSLFFLYLFSKKKQWLLLIIAGVVMLASVYTGSRALLFAMLLSALLFLFQRKYLTYLISLVVIIILVFLVNNYFLIITTNTFLFQDFSLLTTFSRNFMDISRFQIWHSWWIEVKQFNLLELLIGKSFITAILANKQNLNYQIWFHNDFLNIFYTYGMIGFALYVGFFIKIYHDVKSLIKQNFFIYFFYSTMVITAFMNGFYYYFPVFILYLFFLIIQNEKAVAR